MKIDIDFGDVQSKLDSSPRGAFSIFVKLNDKVGLKLFHYEEDRNDAYSRQKFASLYNLGPCVHGKVDNTGVIQEYNEYDSDLWYEHCINEEEFNDHYGGYYAVPWEYGYLTEIVETNYPPQFYEDNKKNLFYNLLEKIDWEFEDCKYNNCGVKNGRLVCIDFGNLG